MYRGITLFKCPKCGKVFMGPDFEWNCTVLTAPLPCPECGYPEAEPTVDRPLTFMGKLLEKVFGRKENKENRND